LITERGGLPVSAGVSAASTHDSQALVPLVQGIPPLRSRRGPRRRWPAKLHAGKGYDYDHRRAWLRKRGITPRIARRGIEPSQRLGRHRWVAERTMSWLNGCRRLHRRYERKAGPLPGVRQHRRSPDLLSPARQMKRSLIGLFS